MAFFLKKTARKIGMKIVREIERTRRLNNSRNKATSVKHQARVIYTLPHAEG